MTTDGHPRAEQLVDDAEQWAARGRPDEATRLYIEAAKAEAHTVDLVPSDRPRTLGILAVSAVSLFWRAERYDDASAAAYRYLLRSDMPAFAKKQLQQIVFDVLSESEARDEGLSLGTYTIGISFRGGAVRYGLAPMDSVLLKLEQIQKYIQRLAEWVADRPYRKYGPVAHEIRQICTPLLSAPAAGSINFNLRLQRPLQLELFSSQGIPDPERITEEFFRVIEKATGDTVEAFTDYIPNEQYRRNLLALVRGMAPDGKTIEQIEVRRFGGIGTANATLDAGTRELLSGKESIGSHELPAEQTEKHGTLRSLDLDRGFIILSQSGLQQKCFIRKDQIFDDVVGPLVNHPVRAIGRQENGKFLAYSIELDSDGDLS